MRKKPIPPETVLKEKTRKKHLPDKYKPPKPSKKQEQILPPREYIFVSEYVKDWNSQRAFFCAYPSRNKKTAHGMVNKLLKRPRVVKAILHMQRKVAKAGDISREFILEEALDTYYCSKAVIPIKDREGNPTGLYKSDFNCSIKCLELIARMCGYIQNKVLMQGSVDLNHGISPALVPIDELPLSLEQKKQLLSMIEEREKNTIDGGTLKMNTSTGMPKGENNGK